MIEDTEHEFGAEPAPDEPIIGPQQRAAYLLGCEMAIELAVDHAELREWWRDQEIERAKFGVTEDEEAHLVALCRKKTERLKLQSMHRKPSRNFRRALV